MAIRSLEEQGKQGNTRSKDLVFQAIPAGLAYQKVTAKSSKSSLRWAMAPALSHCSHSRTREIKGLAGAAWFGKVILSSA